MSERTKRHQGKFYSPRSGRRVGRDPDDAEYSGVELGLLTPGNAPAWQRAAGNRAVDGALRNARESTAAAPVPVQRWAWVGATQIKPDDPALDPQMKALASDKLVHDYASDAEFREHAAGQTDHIGNLRGPASTGTWVRFAPGGTNLLGENHTHVTLEHVAAAVGSRNFIYEPFSVDKMSSGSAMKAAYEAENQDRFNQFGVGGVADKQQFGAESLFPKMGYGLNLLVPYLDPSGSFDDLKSGGYVGQPVQRYLKIAWGHGKDIEAKVANLNKIQRLTISKEMKKLSKVVSATKAALEPFITPLPVDGYLGDPLDSVAGRAVVPKLREFCEAFVNAMLAQASTDEGLTKQERKELGKMPKASGDEREEVFGKWRNLHFSHAVRDAAQRGVRYAGMGRFHLDYLMAEGLPPNSRGYDMSGKDLADFETLTKNLAASATKSP
ncbi:hypothetical protein ACWDV4_10165 [Micromonospora sp. NPDC003197]